MMPPVGANPQLAQYPYIDPDLASAFDSIFSGHLVPLDKIAHTDLDYAGIKKEYCNSRNDFAPNHFFVQGYDNQLGRFVAFVIVRKNNSDQPFYGTKFLIITSERKYIECSEKYQMFSRDLNKNHESYAFLKKLFEHGHNRNNNGISDKWLHYDRWKKMHGPKKTVSTPVVDNSYTYSDFC